MTPEVLFTNATVATMATGSSAYGLMRNGFVSVAGGLIVDVGPSSSAPSGASQVVDLGGRLLTPGLVDCHTHLVFGGDRVAEFEDRLAGATYEEIARRGGGIASTVGATRAADTDTLLASARRRLRWLAEAGATTVEVKTGYGLDLSTELRMLDVTDRLAGAAIADVRATLLAAHIVPSEYREDRDSYVDLICDEIIPAAVGRADSVDVFCETIAFSAAETRRIFAAARSRGLAVKVHADQLSPGEGCHVAAEFGALSADHLEHSDEMAVAALAASGMVAVLLPGASSFLDERVRPPVDLLRRHGVPMAVATDLNPGTAPLASPTGAMHLACTRFGLTPEEALVGMTRLGAQALGLADRGVIAPGKRADLAAWDVEGPGDLAYWLGAPLCTGTWLGGEPVGRERDGGA